MFVYFKGLLISNTISSAVIEVNGIGYQILIHARVSNELPQIGQCVTLHTTFVIRENYQALYGFLESQERDVFEVLMNISGIGPKLALSLLGHLSFSELYHAVGNQDVAILCRVPGVGKKTAERLIVELKDKLQNLFKSNFMDAVISQSQNFKSVQLQDAMQALINLGYTQHLAKKALKESLETLPETADLALVITTALKFL